MGVCVAVGVGVLVGRNVVVTEGAGTGVRDGKGVRVGSGGGIASEAEATAATPRMSGNDRSAIGRRWPCKIRLRHPALPERTPAEISDDSLRPVSDTHDLVER